MYKYTIVLCLCVCGILCDLNKEEGAACEWEGLQGKCVKETRCMTTLEASRHPLCSKNGAEPVLCCTDCELVNDTRNAIISPTSGIYWKDGRKARDSCLQYIKELPYQCKEDGYSVGISRKLNEDKKCYEYNEWTTEGEPTENFETNFLGYHNPFEVMLGYGDQPYQRKWSTKGVIVSDRYILTAAHVSSLDGVEPKYAKLGTSRNFGVQSRKLKRFIPYPEYQSPALYHDIALVELDEPIKFNAYVLPACLHVDDKVPIEETFTTAWNSRHHAQRVFMEEFSEEECKAGVGKPMFLNQGYNHTTQICYEIKTTTVAEQPFDIKSNPEIDTSTCKRKPGEAILVDTQFTSCVHTVIGVISFGSRKCEPSKPTVYLTRVSYYVPWIESIVWP